ncbi:VOC family protein [Cellulosimicrobium funkei]|nr:VOC family protein [Cellulosimicrobium funkei]
MTIARYPSFVIDCPDPQALARFYGEILGWEVQDPTGEQDEWVDLQPADGSNCISFQRVADYRAPDWPGQDRPQQMHLDVQVQDLDAGERAVLELGATKTDEQPGESFRVFLDPAGHPFCLCRAEDSERMPEGA